MIFIDPFGADTTRGSEDNPIPLPYVIVVLAPYWWESSPSMVILDLRHLPRSGEEQGMEPVDLPWEYGRALTQNVVRGVGKQAGKIVVNFAKKKRKRPGKLGQFKSTDALRQENKKVDDIVKELQLTKDQKTQLHQAISGEGLSYHEIRELAKEMFNK